FAAIQAEPAKAMYAEPIVDGKLATGRTWRRLPAILWAMLRSGRRMKRQMRTQAEHLRGDVFPAVAGEFARFRAEVPLSKLSLAELLEQFQNLQRRVLDEFAAELLQPAMFAAVAMAELQRGLAAKL